MVGIRALQEEGLGDGGVWLIGSLYRAVPERNNISPDKLGYYLLVL